jgi:transposase
MSLNMPRRHFFLRLDNTAKESVISFMQRTARKRAFRVRRRGNALLLSNQGWTVQQISNQFKVSIPTVRKWFHSFIEKGITGLEDPTRTRSLTPKQETNLFDVSQRVRLLKKTRYPIKKLPTYQQLTQWLKEQYEINLSAKQVSRIIRRKLIEGGT